MRRIIGPLVLACLLVSLNSCILFLPTRLTIQNYSSFDLDFVEWNGYYFGQDQVWDSVMSSWETGIASGKSDTVDVGAASDYVSFWPAASTSHFATVEVVTVSQGEVKTYTIYDSTSVVSLSLTGNTEGRAKVLSAR